MPDPRRNNPRLIRYSIRSLRDECIALWNFLYHHWLLVLIVLLVIGWALNAFNPLPPSRISLGSGQENSTLEVIATQIANDMAAHGVEVDLVGSRGALGNLQLLEERRVDVALAQGGAPIAADADMLSLGSIGHQPLWLFLRETLPNDNLFDALDGQRVSIGLPGSGTRTIMESLLPLLNEQTLDRLELVAMNAGDSIAALRDGDIDAMFLLAGIESGNARQLLFDERIMIHDFTLADGLTRHLDFVESVVLPKGAIQLHPPRPERDVRMIATTTTLLIDKDLHPAIQHLLLRTVTQINMREPSFFARDNGFPAYTDPSVPLSDVAERHYSGSELPLARFLPFWLASLIDAIWFYIFAVIAIGYPLLLFAPRYRRMLFRLVTAQKYNQIREIELEWMRSGCSESSTERALDRLQALEAEVCKLWVPTGEAAVYRGLVNALIFAAQRIRESAPPPPILDNAPPPGLPRGRNLPPMDD